MRNILTLFLLCFSILSYTQINDCVNAQVVCNNGNINFNPSGPGIDDFAPSGNNSGCLVTGEHSSAWYYFEIDPTAPPNLTLEFTIDPTGGSGQDYDFAVFGPDVPCSNLGSPLRCSYAAPGCGFCPQTGLGNGTTDVSEGAGGDGYVSGITVQPGEGFFLLVDNFSNSGIGFDLLWNGSAAPFLNCNAMPPCGLLADAGPDATACEGDTGLPLSGGSIGGQGAETYNWVGSNGSSAYISNPNIANPTLSFPPGVSGIFTFTLTVDELGCTDDDDVTYTINPLPAVSLNTPAPICEDEAPYSLTPSPLGGTWSPNVPFGQVDPAVLGPGTHPVTYTYIDGNGCSNMATTTVVINPEPVVSIAPFNTQLCDNGDPIFLTGTPLGGTWSPNVSGGVLFPPTLGIGSWNITYTYTDANGCGDMATVNVIVLPEPTATITDPGPLCESGPPVFLQANPPGGTFGPNAPGGLFNPSNFPPGTYPVTYTVTEFGCTTSTTQNITVTPEPSVTVQPVPDLCTSSAPVTLVANPPGGNWVAPFNTGIVDPSTLSPGTYFPTYTYLDPAGCLVLGSVQINISAPPSVSINPVADLCQNSNPQTLSANPSGGSWSANAPGGVFDPTSNPPGSYNVSYTYTDPNNGCSETANINVQVVSEPSVSITGNTSFCFGNSTVLGTSGSFNNYSWSTGNNGNSITVANSGTFTVTVTDASGCTATATQTVSEGNSINPTISGGTSICDGTSTTLTTNGGYTNYSWSTGDNGNSIIVANAGTFTVTVTDGSGCTGTNSVTVNTNTSPSPTISGVPSFCPGESTIINTGVYNTYIWSDGSITQNITVSNIGTYTVTVTDGNGCTGTEDIVISENMVSIPTIDGLLDFCAGASTSLTAESGFNAYSWSSGENTPNIVVSTGGPVTVTVTDNNGCTSENSVNVVQNNLPIPTILGNTSICIGASTILNAGGSFVNYQWSNSSINNSISVDQSGTYTVTVTDGNGCTGTAEATVDITPELQPAVTGDVNFCFGGSTALDAGSWTSYQWSDNSSGQSINPSTGGTYTVTVTDGAGCTGSAEVLIMEYAEVLPQISGPTSFCSGTSTTLDAGSWSSYIWSDNSNGSNLSVTVAGTYTVTVTDGNNCTGTAEATVDELPELQPTITGDIDFCFGDATALDAGSWTSYQWSDSSSGQSINPSTGGTYTVTVTDVAGCTGSTEVLITEFAEVLPQISGSTSFCLGTSTSLDAGSWSNYVWSNNSINSSISVSTSGTFTVTVTDVNGCTGTAETTVDETPELQPTITGDVDFCFGGSTALDAGSWTSYQWSDNSSGASINPSAGGTYTVTVTDGVGCTGSSEVLVTEFAEVLPQISGSTSFCTGTSTTLDAGSWSGYIWSDNSMSSSISVSTAGTFTVTVTDGNGCTGTSAVDIIESTSLNPVIVGDFDFCPNGMTTIDAGFGFDSYLWSDGSMGQTLEVNVSGDYAVTVSDASGCTGTTTAFVSENIPPAPTISGSSSFCTGTSTTLDAGTWAGYIWSDGSTNQMVSVSTSGTYFVTITDINGCTGEDFIDVQELASLDPGITGPTEFCENTTTTISAAAGFLSYDWSNSESSQDIEIGIEGTYTVTVTDAAGCTGEQSYFVAQNNNPIPTITGNLDFCPDTSTPLTAETGYVNYLWSDNTNLETIDATVAGTYTVTVTDINGCTGSTEVEVSEYVVLNTTISGTPNFCPNESTVLEASSGFDSYLWSDNSTDSNLTVDQPGTYTVTATDINGCTTTAEIQIDVLTPPSPNIIGAASFCSGNSTTLDATGNYTNYIWSNNSIDPILSVDQSGTYTVTVTDLNGCTGSDELMVSEISQLLPNLTGTDNFCPNENTTITAESGYVGYEWSDGTIGDVINISAAGTYTLTVSDANGCTGTNEIMITENTPPAPMIAGSTTFCAEASTTLDVGANYANYVWSDNSSNSTLTVDTDGVFSVTVTDANGCTGETSIQVTESTQLEPVITGDDEFCAGSSATLDAGFGFDNYIWSDNSSNQTLETTSPGTFTVTVTDASGCTGETSIQVVENTPVNAGTANPATNLCSVDITNVVLGNELVGEDGNGVWMETSSVSSTVGAFDSATGAFNTDGQIPGIYTFEYFIAGPGSCPDDSETVTVIIDATPNATIEPAPQLTCLLTNAQLDAGNSSGGMDLIYQWDTNDGNIISGGDSANPTIDLPGTYDVLVSLPNGCSSTASIVVDQDIQVPDAFAGMNQQLTCTDGQATLSGSSDTPGVIFNWSGPGINSGNTNDQNPIVESAGTYSLTVTNPSNGCESAIANVEVIADVNAPSFTLDPVNFLDCNNFSQVLTGPFSPNFSYQWLLNGNPIMGATSDSYEADVPGIYSLQVTDLNNGCNSTEILEVFESVDPPIVDAGTADILDCINGMVALNGSGSATGINISYEWFDPNGNPIPNSNSTSIDVTQPGSYTLVVTNNDNGCTSSDLVLVTADNNFPVANAGADASLDCDFNSIMIGGNSSTGPTITYQWTTNNGGPIINPNAVNPSINQPGTYQLTVTDANNGCMAIDEIIISENMNLPVQVDFDISPISCEGDNDGSFTVINVQGGTAPYQFSFNGEDFSTVNTFPFLSAGNYSLEVEDAQGCEFLTEITLDDPPPFILNLGPDTTIELGQSVLLNAQTSMPYDSLVWRFEATLPCENCPNPTVAPLETTNYFVTAFNFNGCEDEDDITVFVEKNRHVFIPNVFTPNDDGVNDHFYIFGGDDVEKIHVFKIYSRWGEEIYEQKDIQPNDITVGWDGFFRGKLMNPGVFVYFVEIEFKDGVKIIYKGDVALRK